jgi:hypothetical protein
VYVLADCKTHLIDIETTESLLPRSVLHRKFRIKAAQSCHSDRYCSGKRPLCSGKLAARKAAIHDASSGPMRNATVVAKCPQAAAAGRLIGYARMSTEYRGTDPQCDGHDMLDRYLADSARPS